MADRTAYLVIHGSHHSDKTTVDYVEHIVYGLPDKITAVDVGRHFVALIEYIDQDTAASYSMQRMGSFPYGAQLMTDRLVAIREFGAWTYHYAPGSLPRAAGAATL